MICTLMIYTLAFASAQRPTCAAAEVPPPDFVQKVKGAVQEFWEQREARGEEGPEQCIAIHCAYGFNRTGFVVCSLLVELYGLGVTQALEAFAAARPPGVKHAVSCLLPGWDGWLPGGNDMGRVWVRCVCCAGVIGRAANPSGRGKQKGAAAAHRRSPCYVQRSCSL